MMSADARPGRGRTVVFVHGIAGGARLWALQVKHFEDSQFRPVALDLPGYGARPPVDRMDFEEIAADVEDAIVQRQLPRPVLVGHSMGGMVVQTMLRRRPDAYEAAVLACTSPAFGNISGEFQRKFVADRLGPLDAGRTMGDIASEMAISMMGPHPDQDGRALAIEAIAATPAATYRAAIACLVGFDERSNLGAIRIPVLCLAAGLDRAAPPSVMERMATKIPSARYCCLDGVGHLANVDAPRAFDAAIFEFLDRPLARQNRGN